MKEERTQPVIFRLDGRELMNVVFMYVKRSPRQISIAESCIVNGKYVLFEDFMCMYAPSFFKTIDIRIHASSKVPMIIACNDSHFKRYPCQQSDVNFNQNQR